MPECRRREKVKGCVGTRPRKTAPRLTRLPRGVEQHLRTGSEPRIHPDAFAEAPTRGRGSGDRALYSWEMS